MTVFDAIIFAVVEGITEFLPVSSTGHLILTARLLSIPQTDFVKTFEVFIQLGAMLSVVALYAKKFFTNKAVWIRVAAGFIPTAIIGLFLYKIIKTYLLGNVYITLLSLLIGGILLILFEKFHKEKDQPFAAIEDLPVKSAVFIGIFQGLSVIPGVSRSAATILSAVFLGAKRTVAVEYSFLLAVPTMLAASTLDLVKMNFSFTSEEYIILSVGFAGSFLVALVAIKFFLSYIRTHSFTSFGIYRIVLAVLFWLFILH